MDSSTIRIQNGKIQYSGKDYPLEDVSVELLRRDPVKGITYLFSLAAAYVIAYFVMTVLLSSNSLYSLLFIIYILSFVIVANLAYEIVLKFLLDSAVIHLDSSTKFSLPASGVSREMISAIVEKAKTVDYVAQVYLKAR